MLSLLEISRNPGKIFREISIVFLLEKDGQNQLKLGATALESLRKRSRANWIVIYPQMANYANSFRENEQSQIIRRLNYSRNLTERHPHQRNIV